MQTVEFNDEIKDLVKAMDKSTKKPVDANAPKRPLSAFFIWANEHRDEVKVEHNLSSLGEIGKKLGALWKNMDEGERKPWVDKAMNEKAEYEKKMAKYIKTSSYLKHEKNMLAWKIHGTKKPYKTDPNAPKRALSSYMLFGQSERANVVKDNPDFKNTEIMKELGVRWKALTDAERAPWKKKFEDLSKGYQTKLDKYKKSASYKQFDEDREEYKTKMKKKRNKLMGIKPKPKRKQRWTNNDSDEGNDRKRTKRDMRSPKSPKSSKSKGKRSKGSSKAKSSKQSRDKNAKKKSKKSGSSSRASSKSSMRTESSDSRSRSRNRSSVKRPRNKGSAKKRVSKKSKSGKKSKKKGRG